MSSSSEENDDIGVLSDVRDQADYCGKLNVRGAIKIEGYDEGERMNQSGRKMANLWTEFSAHDVEALVANRKNRKTLDFPRWLQLSKRQILTFMPVV